MVNEMDLAEETVAKVQAMNLGTTANEMPLSVDSTGAGAPPAASAGATPALQGDSLAPATASHPHRSLSEVVSPSASTVSAPLSTVSNASFAGSDAPAANVDSFTAPPADIRAAAADADRAEAPSMPEAAPAAPNGATPSHGSGQRTVVLPAGLESSETTPRDSQPAWISSPATTGTTATKTAANVANATTLEQMAAVPGQPLPTASGSGGQGDNVILDAGTAAGGSSGAAENAAAAGFDAHGGGVQPAENQKASFEKASTSDQDASGFQGQKVPSSGSSQRDIDSLTSGEAGFPPVPPGMEEAAKKQQQLQQQQSAASHNDSADPKEEGRDGSRLGSRHRRDGAGSEIASQPSGTHGETPADKQYEWVSDMLSKMWPYIREAVTKEARVQLPPLIQASKPSWLGSIKLHKLQLGAEPPKLTDIRVMKDEGGKGLQGDEYIHLELDFDWDSQQDVEMDVAPVPDKMRFVPTFVSKAVSKATEFRCGVENFEIFGKLMIAFRPVMHQLPVIGAVQVCFVEAPTFDFDITLGTAGSKLLDILPALKSWLYGFIADTLLAPYILPDHFFYPIDPAAPDYQVPVGYVEVTVIEAKNVPSMDYLARTSPYVQVSTHKRGSKKTKNGDHHKHPHWNETFKLPVHVVRYQHVSAILYDEDVGEADDEVGRSMFPVRELKAGEAKDVWLDVKPLMSQEEEGEDASDKARKRDKFRRMLTKPMGPPDPQHKGTALHLRLTYHDLTEEQVKEVMEAESTKQPITDPFLKELLDEDMPSSVVAGDRAKETNPAPLDDKDAAQKQQRNQPQPGDTSGVTLSNNDDGVEMLQERARPESADPEVARRGEMSFNDYK